jgi:hypothetical protein
MTDLRIIADGDPQWWHAWKSRLEDNPLHGTIRFTFLRVMDVNEKEQEFEARLRIDCEIDMSRFENPRRVSIGGGKYTNYVVKADPNSSTYLEEFNPKLVFMNLKRSEFPPSKWVRRPREGFVMYSIEVTGK